ncbi:MFS transporter [Amycolatopsis jiangsuensis]|uniref:MFS family permease n=1 Tax=Amycolatopsis jiangsuensis TaxID=1181879 RepID=A0A840ISE8_9PSEU|nr:MFS transporter [Amycolatopsis jiangsuensis]MBB4684375.1 MFS family permease [Amycolatopsis jiangsuensis]
MNVLEQVKNSLMSRAQVRAVALCLVINLIDGFDLLVTSFAGPAITWQWGLFPSAVGVLLSGGLAGMAVGGLFLAPLADRVGRRRLTLGCLALASLGMLAAAAAQDFDQLLACRVVTGRPWARWRPACRCSPPNTPVTGAEGWWSR